MSKTDEKILIRKYRKKIRQIESLERLNRELTEEEEQKIYNKYNIRSALQEILSRTSDVSESDSAWTQQTVTNDQNTTQELDSSTEFVLEDKPSRINTEADLTEIHEETGGYEDEEENEEIDKELTIVEQKNIISEQTESLNTPQTKRVSKPVDKEKGDAPIPVKKSKKDKKSKDASPESELQITARQWRKSQFDVTGLEGHSDLVCSLSVQGHLLLTGSRDTTLKLWNLKTMKEVRSMGGHTGCVTAVVLLTNQQSTLFASALDLSEEEETVETVGQLALSGSQDCSIKIWAIKSGKAIKSFYTFSPVNCITTTCIQNMVILYGSGGGKLEVWDPKSETVTQSLQSHEGAITGIAVEDHYVYTSGEDGFVAVHEIRDTTLHTVFESENVKSSSGGELQLRKIRSPVVNDKIVYYGDDGINVKAMNWMKGMVHKLSNHAIEFGSTDALCCYEDILLAAGYDIDNGIGYINVRHLPSEKYLCSLCDEDTSRIVCLGCTRSQENMVTMVTGGMELVVWKQMTVNQSSNEDQCIIEAQFISTFDRAARNSDVDTEGEMSESEHDEILDQPAFPRRNLSMDSQRNKGWLAWCSIL